MDQKEILPYGGGVHESIWAPLRLTDSLVWILVLVNYEAPGEVT